MGLPKPYYDRDGITIYCADCRDILPLLEPGSVDVVLADPPYGIANTFGQQNRLDGSRRLQFDWDSPGIVEAVRSGLSEAFSLCKPRASCFVWTGCNAAERYAEPATQAGFTVKPAAWVKQCPPPACPGNWWPSGFELAYYGYRGGAWFNDDNPKRRNVWVADSYRYGQPGKCDHPTQKPLGMTRQHVAALVPPGGLVLDPFMGSGTTLRAAKDLGRRAIGIEIEEKYCEIAVRRLAQGVLPFGD
jgi:site-specific DNA-methyltransferase (adenine-specific)